LDFIVESIGSWGALFAKGGVLMYPLAFCSFLAFAVIIERLWALQRKNVLPPDVMIDVEGYLHRGLVDDGIQVCHKSDAPIARILEAGLLNVDKERHVIREVMEEAGRREVAGLERFTGLLGVIAGVAPLIGLLGTVVGMIKAFRVIATKGVGDPNLLAGGIGEALFTTAAGLTVAIPAFIMHRYFLGRIDRL